MFQVTHTRLSLLDKLDQYQQEVNNYEHFVKKLKQNTNNYNKIIVKNIQFPTKLILWNDYMLTILFNANIPKNWIISMKKLNNNTVCLFCVNNIAKKQINTLLLQYVYNSISAT
jgi:hypothetical protein